MLFTTRGDDRDFRSEELIPVVARTRAAEHPRTVPFEEFRDGRWRAITLVNHVRATDALAAGLIAQGVGPGDRVAIMATTRYEWVLLDMAIWTAGAVTVPIGPSSSAAQIEWILGDSGATLLFAEGEKHRSVLATAAVPGSCRRVYYLDDDALNRISASGVDVSPSDVDAALATLSPDSPSSIVYTSGTTERPRGCVLTHATLLAEAHGLLDHPISAAGQRGNKSLMFLPLANVLARSVTYVTFLGGGTTGFWSDLRTLPDRLADFRPHLILGVPRFFEKVHGEMAAQARSRGRVAQVVFARAEQVAVEHSRRLGGSGVGDTVDPTLFQAAEYALYDRVVYSRVRATLGARCRWMISGGEALPDRVAHFFRGVGVPVHEGYGLTETCAAVTCNGPCCQRVGTVGRAIGSNEIALAEDGEIRVRGPVVFTHYWNDDAATAAAFDDGWFATGDLGSIDEDGYLRITGRRTEIIVTAAGGNLAPVPHCGRTG